MIKSPHHKSTKRLDTEPINTTSVYSVEFFHIYTDEIIGDGHKGSLNYLHEASKAWGFPITPIVLIDNYNPIKHILTPDDVFDYLELNGFEVDYWGLEADMVPNARVLLASITKPKLKREYERYIKVHGKLPCSLLTASWYLTRLGHLDNNVISSRSGKKYSSAQRLINILPAEYKEVEARARELITNSVFSEATEYIQDLFYPAGSHRKVDLF